MNNRLLWKGERPSPGQALFIVGFLVGAVAGLGIILVVEGLSLWDVILWVGAAYFLTKLAIMVWRVRTGQSERNYTPDLISPLMRFGESKSRWLRAAIALAGLTMFVGWWLLVWQQPDTTQLAETVPFILARVFVLGVLGYALVWSGKMFRAATHNQNVKEHRRDALETFETFENGTSDGATKDAVLVEATRCIFSHRPSGFGQQEADAAPASHMLELTRNVMVEPPRKG